MEKKHRQNFTVKKETLEEFKKVCDQKSVNMSKLIENYMEEYIKEYTFNNQIKSILDNIEEIKAISLLNSKEIAPYNILKLSDYEDEVKFDTTVIARKMITIILFCSNLIATKFRCGPARICIMSKENCNILSQCIRYDIGISKNEKFIGDIKIIENDTLGNIVLCLRLPSDYDIKSLEENIDISKQYVGFEILK